MRPAQASAIVLLAAWVAVAAWRADAHCLAGQTTCQGITYQGPQLAEARTPLDFIESKKECRRFETRQEARNVRDWNALDIVPLHVPVPTEAIEAQLQRVGGMRLVLRVDAEAARKQLTERGRDDVRGLLREAKIPLAAATIVRGDTIETRIKDEADVPRALRAIEPLTSKPFPVLEVRNVSGEGEARRLLSLTVTQQALAEYLEIAQQNAAEYLSRRVRDLGYEPSLVQLVGERRILVVVPGLKDFDRLLGPMPSLARLDFHLADGSTDPCATPTPADSEVVTDDKRERSLLVKRRLVASNGNVVSAVVARDPHSRAPAVVIRLSLRASSLLQAATRDNGRQLLAILLDRQVIAAPIIREPLETGAIWISGDFTLQQAKDLVILVRAANFLERLTIVEREIIEPTVVAPR